MIEDYRQPVNVHQAYHAHIYFDADTVEQARDLYSQISNHFELKVGRFHEKLVGPHPRWSFQVIFGKKDFDRFVPWLDANRNGLTIFVHGLTGDDIKDHTDHAYWLGQGLALHLDVFGIAPDHRPSQ